MYCIPQFLFTVLLCFLCVSCSKKQSKTIIDPTFTTDLLLKTTPIKQQGPSSCCWIYGVLAMLETDRLEQGDSINLSPAFIERALLQQNALKNYLGTTSLELKMRGMMPQTFDLIKQVGLITYDSYPNNEGTSTPFLLKKVLKVAQQAQGQRAGFNTLSNRVNALLDDEMGALPLWVFLYGMQYTPQQFAQSIYKENQYQSYTSFTHHPFYEEVTLEVPDNTYKSTYINVPLDSLMHILNTSLAHHKAVCWEGAIPKNEFSFQQGIAHLPLNNIPITQAERQKAFEKLFTTDQHVMCIIGKAHNGQGETYYIAKNSWGTNNRFGGLVYLSENFLKLRTVALMCAKEKQ